MHEMITNIPIRRENRHCPEHGTYEACSMVPEIWTPCPVCQENRDNQTRLTQKVQDQARKFQTMLQQAGLGKRFMDKSLDNYLPRNAAQRRILELAVDYAKNFAANLSAGRCLAFTGDAGNGKTHLGVALLREIISAGHSGRYVRAYDLFKAIKESWNSIGSQRSETEALGDFTKPDLLVLDVVGVQFNTGTERTLLFQVIDARYNDQLPTVVISNLGRPRPGKERGQGENDWEPRQNPKDLEDAMGFRSYDRLTENGGRIIEFHGESFRRATQRPHQKEHEYAN